MYLKNIVSENSGPIKNVNIELEFTENELPKPIILVGENGKGKSTLLGNLVDSLYEFSKQAYDDIVDVKPNGKRPYFRTCSGINIKVGEKYSINFLRFSDKSINFYYLEKVGNISKNECENFLSNKFNIDDLWRNDTVFKSVTQNKKYFEDEFKNKSICYFPPDRYQTPYWMNKNIQREKEHLKLDSRIAGKLKKPIMIEDISVNNIDWLLDIIVDSRADVIEVHPNEWQIEQNIGDIRLLKIARSNVEEILSEILRQEVKFGLNWRNDFNSRFNVIDKKTGNVIMPNLNSLSTGQSALFNIFSTIIRYSDYNDIKKSISLDKIEGIVIIDEIELHLHSTVQKEILPKLIRKFPKVQFIITSHSPLFIMGMENEFGKDGFSIFEMPNGEKISSEEFSEFEKSYNYYKDTHKYKFEIKQEIDKRVGKILIVTEGCTDWKHLKRALKKLKEDIIYGDKFKELDVDFLEFEDRNSSSGLLKLDMGDTRLVEMCEYYARMQQKRKIIFIGDRDTKISEKLAEDKHEFKNWGNNVYSFQIPVPKHRENTPKICIEHYYSDEEIKTYEKFDDGISRRLFMGNDFNSHGIKKDDTIMLRCEKPKICGKDNINIIDGSSGEKVFCIDDENYINYAISKTRFVDNIINEKDEFANIGYESFAEIFNIIKKIEEL